jgi:tRNA 2-selenouridine synthase
VAGLAGAGKTELLTELCRDGEQVLDLEGLARHRGSAFGAIGLAGSQPSHREFAGAVTQRVDAADPRRVLWVEDEGPFIGSVGLPPWLAADLARAPVVRLDAPVGRRIARLTMAYSGAPTGELLDALQRCRRRLGDERTAAARARIAAGDVAGAVAVVLPWFDDAYRRRVAAYGPREVLAALEERRDVAAG